MMLCHAVIFLFCVFLRYFVTSSPAFFLLQSLLVLIEYMLLSLCTAVDRSAL